MAFFNFLFFALIGGFSLSQVNAQINDKQSEFVQTAQQTQCSIKAIIFDCDGTLIDSESGHFLAWQRTLQCQGYELHADEFWDFMHGNGLVGLPRADEMIVKYCCELLGRDCAAELLEDKKVFSAEIHHTYEFPVIEPTVNFLHALGKEKERLGLKIGLASGNTKENILRVLKRLKVDQYFDAVVSADDLTDFTDPEGTSKPKPYIYLHTSKLLGVEPEQCVAIEDSRTGIFSAVDAGCIAVAIPNTHTIYQDLSYAHLKVTSFAGVTPTDFLCLITDLKMNESSNEFNNVE